MSKHDQMVKRLDRAADLHLCNPDDWVARVVGGDPRNGPGVSQWVCPKCRDIVVDIVAAAYPDVSVVTK